MLLPSAMCDYQLAQYLEWYRTFLIFNKEKIGEKQTICLKIVRNPVPLLPLLGYVSYANL